MASKEKINYSIHPRAYHLVDKSFNKGTKTNTCAPRNDARKGTLAKREAVRSARRTAMAATMADVRKAPAFKVPGSMRGW